MNIKNKNIEFEEICKNGNLESAILLLNKYPEIIIKSSFENIIYDDSDDDCEFYENIYYNDKYNALQNACLNGNLDLVKLIFTKFPDINYCIRGYHKGTDKSFLCCCNSGNIKLVKWYINKFNDIDLAGDCDDIIIRSCKSENLELLQWILVKIPNVEKNISDINNIIETLAYCKNYDLLIFTFERFYNLYNNKVLFDYLCDAKNIEALKWILYNQGLTFKIKDKHIKTLLYIHKKEDYDTVDLLFNNFYNIKNYIIGDDMIRIYKKLEYACNSNNLEYAKSIFENYKDVFVNPYSFNKYYNSDDEYFSSDDDESSSDDEIQENILNIKENILENAIVQGNLEMVKWIYSIFYEIRPLRNITYGYENDIHFLDCCGSGNIELIKWYIEDKYADKDRYNPIIREICKVNSLELLEFVIERMQNIDNYINIFTIIIDCENQDLIKFLCERFYNTYCNNELFITLCINKNIEILQWFIDKYDNTYDINFINKVLSEVEKDDNIVVYKWLYSNYTNMKKYQDG